MKLGIAFLSGLLFAIGLGVAGMTNPAKVIGFLDFAGAWDASLLFVMAGALAIHLPFVQRWQRRAPAVAEPRNRRGLQNLAPLVLGSAIFGVGWGLSGLCPGPAFVTLTLGTPGILVFVAAMFAGTALTKSRLAGRLDSEQAAVR
jgi:uncharacterized membrane protein YedE/YeeE